MRREMFEDGGRDEREDREMEAKKRRYMEFAKEIEAAVEAGKLSQEDAEEKLIAVRREMFEEGGRGERKIGKWKRRNDATWSSRKKSRPL